MSASIVSRVSVNTASAAINNDSADTSAFVADSPIYPSVLQMLFSLHVVPPALSHVSKLSLPPRQHGGLIRGFERFTPDPEEGSSVIGTVLSDSWSSRASSAPVSRSRFVDATGHIVSGTVGGRTRSLHSAECQPFLFWEGRDGRESFFWDEGGGLGRERREGGGGRLWWWF